MTVKALDENSKPFKIRAKGLLARVIQHEHDHLEGILFLDRMGTFETLTYLEEYERYWGRHDDEDEDDE